MKTFKAVSTDDLTGHSPETIDFLSQKAYDYLEAELEQWFQQSHWNRIYDKGVKLGKEHVLKNFDLVVDELNKGVDDGLLCVYLIGKSNTGYVPFKIVIDKEYGKIE